MNICISFLCVYISIFIINYLLISCVKLWSIVVEHPVHYMQGTEAIHVGCRECICY